MEWVCHVTGPRGSSGSSCSPVSAGDCATHDLETETVRNPSWWLVAWSRPVTRVSHSELPQLPTHYLDHSQTDPYETLFSTFTDEPGSSRSLAV